jgi:hypothetical protein
MANCTYVDGIGSSQAIDTAGEIVDIAGLDCSSLIGGALNWEHKSDTPAQLVGKILEYKKIFSEKDCETDRHRHFWNKCQIPFLYILGRLFDDKKDSSKEAAALFKDDAEHPNEKPMLGFSVEGSKIDKKNMTITRSIARKITLTNLSANKTCVAELLPMAKDDDFLDSIFKTEAVEFFKPDGQYLKFLQKKEKEMNKEVGSGGGAFIGGTMGLGLSEKMEKAAPAWGAGKKSGNAVHFSHPEHGTVSIHKQPSGEFHVKHNGAMAGIGGVKGSFKTPQEAGAHAKTYMGGVGGKKVLAPKMHNRPSPSMINKSLDAGSSMAAPSQLTGGAALGVESLSGKKKKSVWLARAEEAYNTWEKKEEFRSFMKKRLPNMAMGEIDAIGKTLALKKTMDAEKQLKKYSSYFNKGTDIMMVSEKKEKK